ncbi:MAG: c-type cytochrome [Flavobacteriales bacterium]|nr:c-type cytochrome [Flavobacteriales bacterium]
MSTNYILLAVALVQVTIILSLSAIIRTLGTRGGGWLKARNAGAALLVLGLIGPIEAEAATGALFPLATTVTLFWWLVAANVALFVVLLVQLNYVRGMARSLSGPAKDDEPASGQVQRPGFADDLLKRLTRTVEVEKEEDVLMHHEYDGIHELDNVLPPWWVWLFYGTIAWGVIYLVNVHVINVWPDQETAYVQEMEQAKADVERYLAQFSDMVDENSATFLTDEPSLNAGKAIWTQYCVACHGAGGEGGVGPNMTDEYWIHGGGTKNIFHTIAYGVPEKGMIAWKAQLKPSEIEQVMSYILTLEGTNPPNPKEPQGEVWAPEGDASPVPAGNDSLPPATEGVEVASLQ